MRRVLICLILLIVFFPAADTGIVYAGFFSDRVSKDDTNYPNANPIAAGLEKTAGQDEGAPDEALKEEKEAEEEEKKELEEYIGRLKKLYEKMAKRTKDCTDELDNSLFTVNSLIRKAQESKDSKAYKELIVIASDYNSVIGDVGLMQVIIDLGKFFEGEKFEEYYNLMESGYERLKSSFSLKNDLFLKRIDELRNKDALRYGKKLLRLYREYFQYDPRMDKIEKEDIQDEIKQEMQKRGQ